MNTRSNQEILNKFVEEFIIKETPRCIDFTGACVYAARSEEQIGCAIGMCLSKKDAMKVDSMLDDTEVNPLGNSDVHTFIAVLPKMFNKYFDEKQEPFLCQLQNIHDTLSISDTENKVIALCIALELEIPNMRGSK